MRECVTHHMACDCREALHADLEAEVRRLRAERAAMLDVIEAAKRLADTCYAETDAGMYAMDGFDAGYARMRDLIGDDDE